ncbi:MAG TPA: amidophosphoribosyltransferase [Planctomycetota bacterium]|nr:amidophosphoribosyltransferase [Planctomycetota bacterium]
MKFAEEIPRASWESDLEESVGHHCGLFGAYNVPDAAFKTYYGLFALQHRGQESAGIAASDGKEIRSRKAMGLVTEIFNPPELEKLKGHIAVGHVRYSTTGSSRPQNIQPLIVDYSNGLVAVAHNGNLVNARTLRDEYEAYGSIFQTSTDSEIIVHLMARPEHVGKKDHLAHCLRMLKGAYSFLFMTREKLVGARDPHGFRPLLLGRIRAQDQLQDIGDGYVLCSESCALDQVGAEFIREIEPGEVITIGADGIESSWIVEKGQHNPAHCIFEHVYFARPDSMIFGDHVHDVRIKLGMRLAQEHPVKADVVFAVPDSGNTGAIGYSRQSGIPYDMGFIRNHYVGRSFIKPSQTERDQAVAMKFNAVRSAVRGKRVVVVDDSLIRGTTFQKQARLLKQAGATEVHLRITCPPTLNACYYGIDFPHKEQLVAARYKTVEDIAAFLGVNSLGYLSVEGLLSAVSKPSSHYCTACWTGKYPVKPVDNMDKFAMENQGRTRGQG